MANLINPKCKLEISFNGVVELIDQADIEFSIDKDLSEEENAATFTVHNLNSEKLAMLQEAAENDAPIKFSATTIENPADPYVLAFAGEIDYVKTTDMRPGLSTVIECTSQKINHREFWFQKTYSAGTQVDDIINELKSAIGLPDGNFWLPSADSIILSKSFAGPAYELLQRFMFDRGMYCYIMDGQIFSSLVSVAPSGVVTNLDSMTMRGIPEATVRNARNLIEMKTSEETTGKTFSDPLFENKRKKKRRKKKTIEIYGQNTSSLVTFEAVDQKINGFTFTPFFHPSFNPDNMFAFGGNLYRAISVHHEGDNFGGSWDTDIDCDVYEDTGGDFIGQL